ncbi:MAG: hypothetical protein ACHQ15_03945 [Candidatus Limnocylindrales bacterium]
MKVRRVDLVPPDDPAYLAAMSEAAQAHRRLGPAVDPGHIYRASGGVETAVRGWLGERMALQAERIIDAELLLDGRRTYERRFIELDAVEGAEGVPTRVIEAKFSASPSAIRRGLGQLSRARQVLRWRWEGVRALLVLVEANRSGVEIDRERLRDLRLIEAGQVAGDTGRDAPLLVLSLDDLTGHLSADDLAAIERGRDEGDDLTSRRRERAAGDGPERGLDAPPRRTAIAGSATFGGEADDADSADDSPFAALRGLVLPPEG